MKQLFGSFIATVVLLACLGCLGGGAGGNPNLPSSRIDATTTIAGVSQAWVNAYVSANAFAYGCNPGNDSFCYLQIGNRQTDSQGHYVLSSDAIPGVWGVAGAADPSCSTGASYYGQVSASVDIPLTCGQINPTYPALSPSTCSKIIWINSDTHKQSITTNCPSTVSLTTSAPTFPTNHALSVTNYNDAGQQLSSQSITASSPTNIRMPLPSTQGYSVVVIRDPVTGNVMGSSLFDYVMKTMHCSTYGDPPCP